MNHSARTDRIAAAWPTEAEVRERAIADPRVSGAGWRGLLFGGIALGSTLLWAVPFALISDVPLRGAWQGLFGIGFALISFGLMLVSLCCAVVALFEFSYPRRALRSARLSVFADNLGLVFTPRDWAVSRRGIFFGEPTENTRGYLGDAYLGSLCISDTKFDTSKRRMRMGVARARFDRPPYGPHRRFRYLSIRVPGPVPHLLLTATTHQHTQVLLPGAQRMSLEGNFDRFFETYAPEGMHRNALEVLTPDVMAGLIDYGTDWDIELVGDELIVLSRNHRARDDRREVSAMLTFFETVSGSVVRQAQSYSRSRAPGKESGASEPRVKLRWRAFDVGAAVSVLLIVTSLAVGFVRM